MLKKSFLSLIVFFIINFLINGCGTSNVYQGLMTVGTTQSSLELAEMYLDEGNYTKALKYLDENSSGKQENILYAQCQMGLAGVELSPSFPA